jgi:ATP-binding cassette subfamily B multidrug efflux pump
MHQVLLGNYPMIARWQMHRFLLRHSMTFFANEFAGRVATKVMQTSLAVRETVMKILDVFVYVVSYFISMIVVIAAADWRLMIPILVWLGIYVASSPISCRGCARSPRAGGCALDDDRPRRRQLHQHRHGEAVFACGPRGDLCQGGHGRVPADRAPADAQGDDVPYPRLYQQLRGAVRHLGLSIWFWLNGGISVGAIAIAIGLAMRVNGMSQWIMWEVSALFENIGTVYDGMEMMTKAARHRR